MNPSEKFFRQLRSGDFISDGDAGAVNRWQEIDVARKLVIETDRDKLLYLVAGDRQPLKSLAITLLQPFATQPQVYEVLTKIWTESSDYETRYAALWRLLDNPSLPHSLHHEIFAFIQNDWPRFLKSAGGWYGEPAKIIPGLRARLEDPQFPETKAWVYLCVALSSPDGDAARNLIAGFAQSPNPFTAEVTNVCLARLVGKC